ncbi:hypothetical protein JRO89_XS12G0173400 [Xanthoceras sorbifolium]|uniref:Uncharacterized protein n=1 Tax=Xanthoceras sorbifolium TaxID=99658 RepID=A0ABQ8HCX9_9ROSI|nr:hypothetical protein JRO89_XS12G0173400 [Xanthoceras sorbifolium]
MTRAASKWLQLSILPFGPGMLCDFKARLYTRDSTGRANEVAPEHHWGSIGNDTSACKTADPDPTYWFLVYTSSRSDFSGKGVLPITSHSSVDISDHFISNQTTTLQRVVLLLLEIWPNEAPYIKSNEILFKLCNKLPTSLSSSHTPKSFRFYGFGWDFVAFVYAEVKVREKDIHIN